MEFPSTAPDPPQRYGPRVAKAVVWVVFVAFFVLVAVYTTASGVPAGEMGAAIAAAFVLLCVQLFLVGPRAWRLRRTGAGYALFAGQVVLGFAPLLLFEDPYLGLPHFVAGSSLLILRRPWSWVGFGLTVLAMGAVGAWTGRPIDIVQNIISGIVSGLVVYGLTTMAEAVTALHAARAELARLAVATERLRFSRDLHDLLGSSLAAVSLKSELAQRLLDRSPERAHEQLAEIIGISRRAMADLRTVASGYRELSLDEEADAAWSVLSAADVDVRVDMDGYGLPDQVRTVLATVLREGVTNVLRHSDPTRCDISLYRTATAVTMEIANDGVPAQPRELFEPIAGDGGSGLGNLAARVEALDGTLTAAPDGAGRFRLRVVVPG